MKVCLNVYSVIKLDSRMAHPIEEEEEEEKKTNLKFTLSLQIPPFLFSESTASVVANRMNYLVSTIRCSEVVIIFCFVEGRPNAIIPSSQN